METQWYEETYPHNPTSSETKKMLFHYTMHPKLSTIKQLNALNTKPSQENHHIHNFQLSIFLVQHVIYLMTINKLTNIYLEQKRQYLLST